MFVWVDFADNFYQLGFLSDESPFAQYRDTERFEIARIGVIVYYREYYEEAHTKWMFDYTCA